MSLSARKYEIMSFPSSRASGRRRTDRAVNRKGAVDPKLFDGITRRLSRVGSRRAMVGGALATSVLAAAGIPTDVPARPVKKEACLPQGRRCGTRKGDESCKRCCTRYAVANDRGRKRCACRPVNETCNNSGQCCTGNCQNSVCVPGSTCTDVGGACQNNGDCCTSTCGDNICQPSVCLQRWQYLHDERKLLLQHLHVTCFTFICRSPNCSATGGTCSSDIDCCNGFCDTIADPPVCRGCP